MIATALVVLMGFLVGCGGEEGFTAKDSTGSKQGVKEPPGVPITTLGRRFAVFSGPRAAEDELPEKLAQKIETVLRLDVSTSRFSRSFEGEPVYLVPSPQMTCMFTGNEAVGSCWGTRGVRAGIATSTALCGPGVPKDAVATYGIVPDGVEEVTILRTNVPDLTVPVRGNVYVGLTSSEPPLPLRLFWIEDGERVESGSGIPKKIAREGCASGGASPGASSTGSSRPPGAPPPGASPSKTSSSDARPNAPPPNAPPSAMSPGSPPPSVPSKSTPGEAG